MITAQMAPLRCHCLACFFVLTDNGPSIVYKKKSEGDVFGAKKLGEQMVAQ